MHGTHNPTTTLWTMLTRCSETEQANWTPGKTPQVLLAEKKHILKSPRGPEQMCFSPQALKKSTSTRKHTEVHRGQVSALKDSHGCTDTRPACKVNGGQMDPNEKRWIKRDSGPGEESVGGGDFCVGCPMPLCGKNKCYSCNRFFFLSEGLLLLETNGHIPTRPPSWHGIVLRVVCIWGGGRKHFLYANTYSMDFHSSHTHTAKHDGWAGLGCRLLLTRLRGLQRRAVSCWWGGWAGGPPRIRPYYTQNISVISW